MRKLLLIMNFLILPIVLMAQVVSGRVNDTEGKPISFANVVLLQKADSTLLLGTATNQDGGFEIEVKDMENSFLQVSCVGYQTQNVEIGASPLLIELPSLSLGMVTVVADKVKKDASSEVYYLTDSLRKNCANALQLLNKLQGVEVDWVTDAIKIGEYRDVPVMVEGREVRREYVRNLNPKSIRRVEVLRYPKGRYGDAPIVMNVILNNAYIGVDMAAYAKGMLSLRKNHSHNADGGIAFTYATKKWNLYGDAGVKDRRLLKAMSYEQTYKDITESTATEDCNHPNGSNGLANMDFSAGVDYKLTPRHVVSLQTWIDHRKGKDKEAYNDIDQRALSNTSNDYTASNITTGAFYRGNINSLLYLSGDVTYNYYDVDEHKQYALLADVTDRQYAGRKNFWRANADVRYVWNDKLGSTIGYTFTNKDYANYDRQGNARLFSSEENRHDAYFSVQVNPSKKFNCVVGSNFLYVAEKNDVLSGGNFSWMPLAKAFWQPFRLMAISANYYCDVQHPNLDQLSTVAYRLNAILGHKGNPELKARVMHYMQYRVDLKDIIQLTYLYKHSSREITPWYYTDDAGVTETLVNGDYIHQYVGLNGDYTLPAHIGVNVVANYQWYKRRAGKPSPWHNGHTWYLDLTATWQACKYVTFMTEYFLRYDKEPLLQGEKYAQNEQWMLGANVSVLKNKLSIMWAATIPTRAIPKRTYSKVSIPGYQYTTWNSDKVNNANILLGLRYNFGKGKASKWQNTNNSEIEK